MPDLNSRGEVLYGGGLSYLTDDTIIGQRDQGGDVWKVSTRPAAGGDWTPIADHGASALAATAGHWLATFYGLRGPGIHEPAMAVVAHRAVAPDGTIAVVLDYHAGRGLRLWRADGTWVDYPDASPTGDLCVVDRDRALWWDHRTRQIETCGGLPRPVTLPGPVGWPTVLALAGAWWIVYHSTDAVGVVLHSFTDASRGYRIALPPAFYVRAVALDANRAVMAWATDPGDAAGATRTIDVTRDVRVPLQPGPQPDPEPDPEPAPEPDPEPTPMYRPIPDFALVVQEVWARATEAQRRTHGWISNAVAWELDRVRMDGRRWFRNLKRGGPDISEDAISTPHNLGAGGWAIIDVVGGFGGPNAEPGWIDVTQATIDKGEIGGGVAPTDPWGGTEPDPGPDPNVAVLRAKIAGLTAELADCHREVAELRARPMGQVINDDYSALLETLAAAGDAYFAGKREDMHTVLVAHLCSRFIIRRDPAERIIEEARLRGRNEWTENW